MTRFIIFASLAILQQFARAAPDAAERRLIVMSGRSVTFAAVPLKNVSRCEVTRNTGERFTLFPAEDLPPNVGYDGDDDEGTTCGMTLTSVTEEDAGGWSVEAFYARDSFSGAYEFTKTGAHENSGNEVVSEVTKYEVFVQQEADLVPSTTLRVFSGYTVQVRLSREFREVRSCTLTDPTGNEIDLLSNQTQSAELFGQCGVRLTANDTRGGTWSLAADVGNFLIRFASFRVDIREENRVEEEYEEQRAELGSTFDIALGPWEATFCQLRRPDGVKLPVVFGACSRTIRVVTAIHEGVWVAEYGLEGRVDTVESRLKLVTYEASFMNASVDAAEAGGVNLLCRFNSIVPRFCSFTRPDGAVIHASTGVGGDRYSYYGNGSHLTPRKVYDCGLTIRRPSPEDYGTWRCWADVGTDEIVGSLLRVVQGQTSNDDGITVDDVRTSGDRVYVKRGSTFTVKCAADAALRYCWLRSPNGTAYSVVASGKKAPSSALLYEGSGLALGECGAVVEKADETHLGDWSCRMGIVGGPEVEATVPVVVTESELIAEPDELLVNVDQAEVHLTCRILPGQDSSINYCRWVRPDGRGIYRDAEARYALRESYTSCSLSISEVKRPEDIGRWTCAAGLIGASQEEARTYIDLRDDRVFPGGGLGLWIALGVSILAATSIILLLVTKVRFRPKRRFFKDAGGPPPYEVRNEKPPMS